MTRSPPLSPEEKVGDWHSDQLQCRAREQSGDAVTLTAAIKTFAEILKLLNSRKLRLGLTLSIKSIAPFDGSMVVSYGKRKAEMLSATVCERLLVEKLK